MLKKWLTWIVLTLALLAGIWLGNTQYSPKPPATEAAAKLYALTLHDAAGKPFALNSLQGKVTVLNFWATWCAPCIEELPEFDAIAKASPKVAFVGIGIDNAAAIKTFAEKHPVSFPLLVAGFEGTDLGKAFGNHKGGLPYTVILGPRGETLWQAMGRVKGETLAAELAKAQAKP